MTSLHLTQSHLVRTKDAPSVLIRTLILYFLSDNLGNDKELCARNRGGGGAETSSSALFSHSKLIKFSVPQFPGLPG